MSQKKQMPYKRFMVIIGIILMLLLVVIANTVENSSGGAFGSKGTPVDLENALPNEERIPTH